MLYKVYGYFQVGYTGCRGVYIGCSNVVNVETTKRVKAVLNFSGFSEI